MLLFLQCLTLFTGSLALSLPSAEHLRHLQSKADSGLMPRSSCENTATSRDCWGEYSIDTNYYDVIPDTGVNREYWLTVEEAPCAPDGYNTTCTTFNGTTPGPTLFADWGDTMTVHVTNKIDNGTSIHWHGVRQLNSVAQDGVPGVTQCPIAPGQSQTYQFRVTQYGSTWYHSHFSLQYGQGLFGGLILNGPATADYDEDLGMLFLGDWHHRDIFELWLTAQGGAPPPLHSGLINGTNIYNCTSNQDMTCTGTVGQKYETVFEQGKKYRIRLVNVAADGHFQFSIDGHSLTVMATDLVPIVPYQADSVLVSIGQRVDVVVEALEDPDAGEYWLRGGWGTDCGNMMNPKDITGIVRYDAGGTASPTTNSTVIVSTSCGDEPYESLVPYLALDVGDITTEADETLSFNLGSLFTWTINNSSLWVNWSDPTIGQIMRNVSIFPTADNVVAFDASTPYISTPNTSTWANVSTNSTTTTTSSSSSSSSYDWALLVIEDKSTFQLTHPIHLHGHDFWVVSQSTDAYAHGTTPLQTTNPPRRDVASLPGGGHLALAFRLDNPGAWLAHCHIAWHASQGLSLEVVESEGAVAAASLSSAEGVALGDQCAVWDEFVASVEYRGQDDSGI